MNSLLDDIERSPEPSLSQLCINLEEKFNTTQEDGKGDSMNVYVRIRPMLNVEIEAGNKECIRLIDEQVVRAVAPASSSKFKMSSHLCQDVIEDFTFTQAYGPETGQFVFFQECMMDTMQNFIEGQNSLVLSYGTTGSGKTFTLQGNTHNPGIIPLSLHLFFASVEDQLLEKVFFKPDKFSSVVALNDNEIKRELEVKEQLLSSCNLEEWTVKNSSEKSLGMLLCETFSDHFEGEGRQTTLGPEEMAQAQAAALMKELSKKSAERQSGYCSIWISFAEIYNENIYDLLQPNVNQRAKLNLGEDKNGDVYVKGLREVCVSNSHEALSLLSLGQRNLRIASTKLNYQSSRSHCIFTVKVIRIPDPENMAYAKVNRLSFCDLAGSERAAKSQTTGMRLKEAGCINTSLLVLGRCLEQLRLNPSQRDKKLIPFRESKLTRLFSGFFTGRGKAVMITNASPSEHTFDETLHVLRFSAVAKELIINDSYITTAANTLQTITNLWTDVKANCKNQSLSSNKSISFEDSLDEVLQEKDELIEKLLDLAESLKSNLQQEKKEKAELEIKIRQDVCLEYSEFRDELEMMQKQAFEEEREAIREIYEKRIAAMEKRYEKIITDFKLQLEDSLSEGEISTDTLGTSFDDKMKQSEMNTNALENGTSENAGIKSADQAEQADQDQDAGIKSADQAEQADQDQAAGIKSADQAEQADQDQATGIKSADQAEQADQDQVTDKHSKSYADNTKSSRETEEELRKTVDYSLSLEVELEHLRKKYEETQLLLENTLKQNDDMKNELETCKINVSAFKTDNESLLQVKSDLEADLKAFRDDLVTVTQEKEGLFQELEESRDKMSCLNTEINNLSRSINELTQEKEELIRKCKSLEEAYTKNNQLKDKLLTMAEELTAEKRERERLEFVISTMEKKLSDLQSVDEDNCHLKNTIEVLSSENDELKNENVELKKKLDIAEATSHEAELRVEEEIEQLKAIHCEEMKKLTDSLKKHETDAKEAEEILKSVNKILGNSQEVIENQKKEIESKEKEFVELRNELLQIQLLKKEMEEKLESVPQNLDFESQERSELLEELEKLRKQATDFEILQSNFLDCKNKIATLEKKNCDLEEQLVLANKICELEKQKGSVLFEKNEEFRKQISDFEILQSNFLDCKNEIATLEKKNCDLEEKLILASKKSELERVFKEQLDSESKKLEEAVNTINSLKNEIEDLRSENQRYRDEIAELIIVKEKFEKSSDISSQNDNFQELLQVLQNCEFEAAHKIEKMQTDFAELKEKFEADSVNHEKECSILHNLIELLEKCEVFASEKTKGFHSASIKYVEQIMDLETSIKAKEKIIDVLKSDVDDLQKKYKDLQASSKKQLQAEMQKFKSETEKLEVRLTDYKKLNESLKCDLAKLEAEKDKLEDEYKKLKDEKAEKIVEEDQQLKNKTPERRISRKRKEENISDEKMSEISVLKEVQNQEDKRRNRKTVEQPEKSIENKKQKAEIVENRVEKRRNKKSFERPDVNTECEKQKTEMSQDQENRRRNRKTADKSDNISENKRQKTKIYEETVESNNNENTKQEKKTGRRHLRCMSNNMVEERESVQKKTEDSPKNKLSKRKVDVSDYKSPEKKTMKKVKMHNVNDAENAHKPQNLRVMLLKSSVTVNDIPLPSPRMTRGRKRLVLAKELTTSPRTVRS